MEEDAKRKRNPVAKLFRMLIEARWFFAFSASGIATIMGISLTFGINSCVENRRVKKEMQRSMLQAVDNLAERFYNAEDWLSVIENQNRMYWDIDTILATNGELTDSICVDFHQNLPNIRIAAFDHDFEKIFRGSYQLWQLQNNGDSLVYYISQCYDGLNMVEATFNDLTESLIVQIGVANGKQPFYKKSPRDWVMTLMNDPEFQYYMAVRSGKSQIAAYVLGQAKQDYEKNVLPRSEKLRKK